MSHDETNTDERERDEALRAAARELRNMPAEPRRDLWPGVAARIRDAAATPATAASSPGFAARLLGALFPRRPSWGHVGAGALAGALVAFTLVLELRHPPAVDPPEFFAASHFEGTAKGLSSLDVLEAECTRIEHRLARASGGSGRIDADTSRLLLEHLELFESAVAEVRAALEANPDDRELAQRIWKTYRARLALLRETVRLTASMDHDAFYPNGKRRS